MVSWDSFVESISSYCCVFLLVHRFVFYYQFVAAAHGFIYRIRRNVVTVYRNSVAVGCASSVASTGYRGGDLPQARDFYGGPVYELKKQIIENVYLTQTNNEKNKKVFNFSMTPVIKYSIWIGSVKY